MFKDIAHGTLLAANFVLKHTVAWLAITFTIVGAWLVSYQVSYQPVMTTGDWIFIFFSGAGIFVNIGLNLGLLKKLNACEKENKTMRDEWTGFKGEMKGEARGRMEQFADQKVWYDNLIEERVEKEVERRLAVRRPR